MRRELPGFRRRFVFTEHHESHAASAFFPSPFESAAVLTVDGVGSGRRPASARAREPHRADQRAALPAFAGVVVLGGDLLHRLQGQ